jgi:translocation and assembly module TamB
VPYSDRNIFARVRFHDIQPFLSRGNLLQLQRVVWKDIKAGPIAGNIELHRNVFAINKLKMHLGDGSVTGQLVFDYRPGAERVKFRGNVTGVRLGQSRERVDANAAVTFCPSRLELDGRMQVLRLSERQMLEMLHVLDPFGEDASFNRVRRAMAFGHPQSVRIALSEGLLSMKVELGGLGALMSLDEVRGVPLGPFMSRHVAPRLPW